MAALLYMVIERFTEGPDPVYRRAAEQGRLLPESLVYVDSWVDERLDRCFQLMETDEPVEVVPVLGSAEAGKRVLGSA